jgi:hypothetical protein
MGRPLNKKYFGNRNRGSASTAADDGIGGTRVASVTLGTLGSYTVRPTITFSAPDLSAEGGVTATGTVTSEVESVTAVGGTQVGYTVGQLITVTGTDAVLRVATIGGTGGDDALTFDFTGGSRGTFTTLPTGAQATTSNGAGVGLTVTLAFRAKAIVITEGGSGYTHAADATASFSGSATLPGTPTVVMITDTGIVGTAGNQENSINMTGFLTGGSSGNVDIIKQVSTNRYKVTDGTRTGIVKLKAGAVAAAGEATIVATDATGTTYYVTKLTAHKATLTRFGGGSYEFATGAAVAWTMNGTSGTKAYAALPYLATGVNVQIANV